MIHLVSSYGSKQWFRTGRAVTGTVSWAIRIKGETLDDSGQITSNGCIGSGMQYDRKLARRVGSTFTGHSNYSLGTGHR